MDYPKEEKLSRWKGRQAKIVEGHTQWPIMGVWEEWQKAAGVFPRSLGFTQGDV